MAKKVKIDSSERVVRTLFAVIRDTQMRPIPGFVKAVGSSLDSISRWRETSAPSASTMLAGLFVQWINLVSGLVESPRTTSPHRIAEGKRR